MNSWKIKNSKKSSPMKNSYSQACGRHMKTRSWLILSHIRMMWDTHRVSPMVHHTVHHGSAPYSAPWKCSMYCTIQCTIQCTMEVHHTVHHTVHSTISLSDAHNAPDNAIQNNLHCRHQNPTIFQYHYGIYRVPHTVDCKQ